MMILLKLEKMSQTDFERYRQDSAANYANEKVRAGTWKADQAKEQAKQEFEKLLPDGLSTPGHYFYDIVASNTKVGVVWLAARGADAEEAFLYDFAISPAYQNQGFGTKALQLIDQEAQQLGFKKIALHVFGHNERAIHVYQKSGFETTDLWMEKQL
jgi:RimJ/RimL family protein N-acetyltransferase